MAIILRGDKGSALTHTELDNNFRQFYYSASYSGTSIYLYTSASLNNEIQLPLTPPAGYDYHIQFKEGNEPSGANALFSSSANFLYDFRQQSFKNTGSFYNVGNATIDGDLVVTGTVTAQEMRTEFNNSSVVFESGSTKFGDTLDDQHSFTGSLEIEGSLTSSADISIKDWGSISSSLQVLTSSIANLSGSVSANYLLNTTDTFTGDLTVTGRINASEIFTTYVTSSILYNSGSNIFGDSATDIHIFTGSVLTEQSITGSDISINEWGSVSASLATLNATVGTPTDYGDLQNIPSGIISSSALYAPPVQGILSLQTNGVTQTAVNILGLQTTSSPTFAGLTVNGNITATGDITAYYSSDERLKDNIQPIPNAVEKVQQIKGVSWDWNELSDKEGHDVGVIAQDLEKVLPELVTTRDTGYKAVRYDKIVALLIEAVKEQQKELNELRSFIQTKGNRL